MSDKSDKAREYGADSIVVLEGLDAVRKRPGMYAGNTTDGTALVHLLWEVLDNAIDEWASGHGGPISVTLHPDGSISVADSGRGIPVEMHRSGVSAAEVVMTRLHTGGVFGPDTHKISAGRHGVGVCVVNALSEWLSLEIHRDGRVWRQQYRQGKPQGPLAAGEPTERTGTRLHFMPDSSIFSRVLRITPEMILPRLRELTALHPGVSIELRSTFDAPKGMASMVEGATLGKDTLLGEPLRFSFEGPAKGGGEMRGEVALQWLASASPRGDDARVYGFANGARNIDGGSHVVGAWSGILQGTRDLVARQRKLSKVSWQKIAVNIAHRTVLAVSVEHPDIQYRSRTKACINNPDVRALLRRVTRRQVVSLLTERPGALAALAG